MNSAAARFVSVSSGISTSPKSTALFRSFAALAGSQSSLLNWRTSTQPSRSSEEKLPSETAANLPEKDALKAAAAAHDEKSGQEKVKEMVQKQAALVRDLTGESGRRGTARASSWDLDEAYDRCLEVMSIDMSKDLTNSSHPILDLGITFVVKMLHLHLWRPEHGKAIAAVFVWCRRTDELVDGINGFCATPEVFDRWEDRLDDLFQGRPHDIYDAALSDVISRYPIPIQLFKDLIKGMRMDLRKKRYESFDELYLYSYHAAGTAGIMVAQILGKPQECKASLESIFQSATSYSMALHLTDILVDIEEDARMGRIYLPQDELTSAGLSDEVIFATKATVEWRNFVKGQVDRIRRIADEGDKHTDEMNPFASGMVWTLSSLNRQRLDNIEANGYDLTKPSTVGFQELLQTSFLSHGRSHARSFLLP